MNPHESLTQPNPEQLPIIGRSGNEVFFCLEAINQSAEAMGIDFAGYTGRLETTTQGPAVRFMILIQAPLNSTPDTFLQIANALPDPKDIPVLFQYTEITFSNDRSTEYETHKEVRVYRDDPQFPFLSPYEREQLKALRSHIRSEEKPDR